MRRQTPIQVIIVRNRSDPLTGEYLNLLKQVFKGDYQGSGNENLYFTEQMGINIPLLDPEVLDSGVYRNALLSGAEITIAVEIISRDHKEWPRPVETLLNSNKKKLKRIKIEIPPAITDGTIQLNVSGEGSIEPSFVPIACALATLEKCRVELIKLLPGGKISKNASRLFISHAKADGMAMAHAIVSLLNRLKSMSKIGNLFRYFFDAESIQPGDEWRKVLETSAKSSLILVLRSEEYENRYWCRQEFLWAERKHMPMIVVDLRRRLYREAGTLPLDNIDTVYISDGNLIRVLFHALRCHIEYLQLQFRVAPKHNEIVLPRNPTSVSIEGAIARLSNSGKIGSIIYPGDTLPEEIETAFNKQIAGKKTQLFSEVEWNLVYAQSSSP
ncbi:MAG: toll/interleukin-1 receptor domain-containing protein [Cyanobacteria bacterium P01_B01_bin.77]